MTIKMTLTIKADNYYDNNNIDNDSRQLLLQKQWHWKKRLTITRTIRMTLTVTADNYYENNNDTDNNGWQLLWQYQWHWQ